MNPDISNKMFNRDEFFIHGSGKKGSDGCIIPGDSSVFPVLDLIDILFDAYGGRIFLRVVSGEMLLPAENQVGGSATA